MLLKAQLAACQKELDELRADRDSWQSQALDRLKDWSELANELVTVKKERDKYREALKWINDLASKGMVEAELFQKELTALKEREAKLVRALEFYAQKPQPDIETAFAKSAEEWGVGALTWEPMTDLGEIAREALKG